MTRSVSSFRTVSPQAPSNPVQAATAVKSNAKNFFILFLLYQTIFYPFSPPIETLVMIFSWKHMKMMKMGRAESSTTAK